MLNAIYHEGFSIMRTDNGFELVVCYDGDFCQEYEYLAMMPNDVTECIELAFEYFYATINKN